MKQLTDQELLLEYAGQRSEEAFGELIRRHVDLVHSTAWRMVRDVHLAQDVTQGVFVALARQAGQLAGHRVLAGWLHRTTRNLAANTVRSEVRRSGREQEAATMNELLAIRPDPAWEEIAQQLDEALGELNEPDRDAVLLRYFEHKTAREMAQIIGSSEEAAQKRVNRAVERLRNALSQRGVAVGGGALILAISTHAVQAAPAGLAATISMSAALGGAALNASTVITTTKIVAMTTLQKTVVTAILATGLAWPLAMQHKDRTRLREENQNLQRQLEDMAAKEQRAKAPVTLAATETDRSREERSELLRLRGEVGVLRQQVRELEALRAKEEQARRAAGAGGERPPDAKMGAAGELASAKAIILNAATDIEEKLAALRVLRAAGERPDDVVVAMVREYHATDWPEAKADIFRQLSGVVNPELRVALLNAVADAQLNSIVRQEAVETLTDFLPDPAVKQWLEYLAANETDEEVRSEVARALMRSKRKLERK